MMHSQTTSPVTEVPMTEVPVTHDAHDLIPHGSLAQIVLDDKTYVLRITRAGKLILTK